ncbi:MAG: hypothetical protein LBI30_04045 [Holosporales bacterium]|nr:hypothetical protein [Holosporales bacterium]
MNRIVKIICLRKYKQCKRHKIPVQAAVKIAQAEMSSQQRPPRRKTYKTRGKMTNF